MPPTTQTSVQLVATINDGLDALVDGDWPRYWASYPVPLPEEIMRRFENANDPKANGAALLALPRWVADNPNERLSETDVPRLVYFGSGEVFADSLRDVLTEKGVAYVERDWAGHAETMRDAPNVSALIKEFLATI